MENIIALIIICVAFWYIGKNLFSRVFSAIAIIKEPNNNNDLKCIGCKSSCTSNKNNF
ncbi:MAG: hypothetical protein HOO06_05075 [Bdellovibrionaceae bacterium]|jgi:hypothetical protein|nr:hypothetical protein [Pseudobdellovibrionaceae bacterium]